ncbi:DUF2798 domain-containing protein [Paenibacillus harenae]|uniref:DUF2798 domain-containing protein n=1 Tax=Paenibacillus harenae TaxID=306543 RepID=A0ABT9U5F7_PAEHA|nr:DUF2798 domain-containing protein [Paenibacillus harenae]MDQ0063342.1 hypothetical protein [Paenibacillus harenae]MDQ0114870.1 hypothetical protein [Paenibacillus harenae]
MKINKKYERITFAFLMALSMSAIISFFMVSVNEGFRFGFIGTWLTTWGMAFFIAFPAACFLPKQIVKIMRKISFID